MKRYLIAITLALVATAAQAWNAAGHRLVAGIAWQRMSPPAREAAAALLRRHPDYPKWVRQGADAPAETAFLGSSTWPDDIRRDPRFFDERSEEATPPIAGLPDNARHRHWHYVEMAPDSSVREGEIDRQIERLARLLGSRSAPAAEKTYALPWLVHLVADIHQPLHVGTRDDEGGNRFEIENPFNPRQPITNLHAWWDDLPGPPWLRGERLERAVAALLAAYPELPRQGDAALWRDESRRIAAKEAYPEPTGSRLPVVTPEFRAGARKIADRRLAEAGYRLGNMLEKALNPVPRETEQPGLSAASRAPASGHCRPGTAPPADACRPPSAIR